MHWMQFNRTAVIMDILRPGSDVEVVQPASLRSDVAEAHRNAAEKYGNFLLVFPWL
jgi:predicted DNA-binding transcriptional regulator YafY